MQKIMRLCPIELANEAAVVIMLLCIQSEITRIVDHFDIKK